MLMIGSTVSNASMMYWSKSSLTDSRIPFSVVLMTIISVFIEVDHCFSCRPVRIALFQSVVVSYKPVQDVLQLCIDGGNFLQPFLRLDNRLGLQDLVALLKKILGIDDGLRGIQ